MSNLFNPERAVQAHPEADRHSDPGVVAKQVVREIRDKLDDSRLIESLYVHQKEAEIGRYHLTDMDSFAVFVKKLIPQLIRAVKSHSKKAYSPLSVRKLKKHPETKLDLGNRTRKPGFIRFPISMAGKGTTEVMVFIDFSRLLSSLPGRNVSVMIYVERTNDPNFVLAERRVFELDELKDEAEELLQFVEPEQLSQFLRFHYYPSLKTLEASNFFEQTTATKTLLPIFKIDRPCVDARLTGVNPIDKLIVLMKHKFEYSSVTDCWVGGRRFKEAFLSPTNDFYLILRDLPDNQKQMEICISQEQLENNQSFKTMVSPRSAKSETKDN